MVVEAGRSSEPTCVINPELEGLRAHVRAELVHEDSSEIGMMSFPEHLPHVRVGQGLESGDL